MISRHGSSPRLRGTQHPPVSAFLQSRFIPAPAGNTGSCYCPSPSGAVHPRACGEHTGLQDKKSSTTGSSPRLRGTHPLKAREGEAYRFIPAPAGNTRLTALRTMRASVHPRACGEHGRPPPRRAGQGGSSPRLRGTQVRGGRRMSDCRFIPAPAGNTSLIHLHQLGIAVHPRACGEHATKGLCYIPVHGSSPRLRGTRD